MQRFLKNLRLHFLIATLLLKRNKQAIFFCFLALIITALLQYKFNFLGINKNTLSEGFIGTYQQHDIPIEVTRLLSSGFLETGSNYRIVPNLASGWEVNHDATEFKFTLKEDVYWSDGSKIKSSDLDFGIPNVEVSFPNDQTVQFKLKEPFSPLPSLLTKPLFKKNTLIGVGPYKIVKLEKSRIFITRLVLRANDKNLPEIIIRFYPNEKIALTGFSLGEVQSVWGVSSSQLTSNQLITLQQRNDYSKVVAILYSTKDPLLSNRSFRQVLSYGAPKIEDVILAKGPFVPLSWAFNGETKDYLSNTEGAKAAMERARASGNPELFKKEMILTATPQHEELGKKIVTAWKELGINALLRVESGIPQNFQALLITQSIPVDPDQYFLWHSTQDKTNLTHYSSARADKNLEDARKTTDEEDRKSKYIDFQKVLMEDSPATFLFFPKYNIIHLKKVEEKVKKVAPLQLPAGV